MSNKSSNQSITERCIRAPLRFHGKAKNLYVQCMNGCAKWSGQGYVLGLPTAYFSLPLRTFPSSDADDFQDLIRANSESNLMKRVGSMTEIGSKSDLVKKMQRMNSCGLIGTIDEDKPCEFGDDLKVRTEFLQQPRSRRSYGVTKRIGVAG